MNGGINLYVYVDNNPINDTDPKGLGWRGAIIGGIIGFIVGDVVAVAETAGTLGVGLPAAPVIIIGSTVLGAAAGHYFEEGLKANKKEYDYGDKENWPWWQDNVGPSDPPCEQEPDDDDKCEAQVQQDEAICRNLKYPAARARCYSSANERYGACRAKKPLPPLITW